jgi:hypothetical protein
MPLSSRSIVGSVQSVARAGRALDRRRGQPVDLQPGAQHLEQIELLLGETAIGDRDIAGQRIGGLVQAPRQGLGDDLQRLLQPVLLAQEIGAVSADIGQPVMIEILEDRQIADEAADRAELAVGHVALGGRDQHHGEDQGAMGIARLHHAHRRILFEVGPSSRQHPHASSRGRRFRPYHSGIGDGGQQRR